MPYQNQDWISVPFPPDDTEIFPTHVTQPDWATPANQVPRFGTGGQSPLEGLVGSPFGASAGFGGMGIGHMLGLAKGLGFFPGGSSFGSPFSLLGLGNKGFGGFPFKTTNFPLGNLLGAGGLGNMMGGSQGNLPGNGHSFPRFFF